MAPSGFAAFGALEQIRICILKTGKLLTDLDRCSGRTLQKHPLLDTKAEYLSFAKHYIAVYRVRLSDGHY